MKRRGRFGALTALAAVVVVAAAFTSAAQGTHGTSAPSTTDGTCQLGNKGKIKHVIYLQFDNVHYLRDNPNVPSDLEQMPHLLKFLKDNGTFDTNDHTILISHTGGGILSSLTGLYPDRHGQAVSNSYNFFKADGSSGFSSSFKYWTDFTDGGNPVPPPTPSADTNYNMVNNDSASLGGTGAVRNAPAPWVPFARAGCDFGSVGAANTVLENNTAQIFRGGPTVSTAATIVGAMSINVANRSGFAVGQTITIDQDANAETAVIASGTGTGAGTLNLTGGLAKAHANGVSVYGPHATDPTGDMTRVFGEGSTEWNEGFDSQVSPAGTARRNKAQTDFVGIAVHCGNAGTSICAGNSNAKTDALPDEAQPGGGGTNGYEGFKALFGAKYVNPAINHGDGCVDDTEGNPISDQFVPKQCGFPGFDGMFARNTLGEVAQMQEAGIPVTFGYISDAHDGHGVAGEIHHAYGPGEQGYVDQLKSYDEAFAKFFARLQSDGITKKNSLFVVTVEEGDHFAGTSPDDAKCDGVAKACTYANVSEVNADLKRLVATYNANHGTTATTDFSVHSDLAPNVYVNGNPTRAMPKARDLEKAMSDITVTNPYSKQQQKLFVAMADPVEEQLLHMVTADPQRTPTFTPFAQGDYFLSASSTTPCPGNDPNACLTTAVTNPNSSFAWNHGGVQPEIRTTWIGWVGPGVENKHQTDKVWTDHTDIRPTMLTLLGLKDDYVTDGRAVTEFLKGDATPKSLDAHQGTVEKLGAMWKQINASFGQFSLDTLCASTGALASNTAGDTTYANIENALATLGDQRDTLANQIRLALWNAEFNGQKIDEHQAKDWIKQGQGYLDQAAELCGQFSSSVDAKKLKKINHIVVIYEENHSFDNLYGGWEGVNGRANADAAHTTQVAQNGLAHACLPQNDLNLQVPLAADACGTNASQFKNQPFRIDDYLGPDDLTCPPTPLVAFSSANGWVKGTGSIGGCTRDIVHRFYHEQYQLDGGKQDRYATGSDAQGLVMGTYQTKALPIYEYLHSKGHPKYAIDDNFFQAAFGGSFLNHQWLIAAATPVDPTGAAGGANSTRHPVLDANGMPSNEPLYTSTLTPPIPPDRELTATCANVATLTPPLNQLACGNYGVNTMQPAYRPYGGFGAQIPTQTNPTIGDRLNDAGIDWAWYAGGWSNADGKKDAPGYTNGSSASATPTGCSDPYVDQSTRTIGGVTTPTSAWPRCPNNLFQYHHQPFDYYTAFSTETAAGQANRDAHLQDEVAFRNLLGSSAKDCNLKAVSFVKPFGTENEHPGYASEPKGSDHLVDTLLKPLENGACAKDTMVIVTYDEFGGQWDHVSPPGQGNNNGPHDIWGPGTRVPTLVISPHLKHEFVVDSAEHDTTSILATIEHRWGLGALGTRDAAVNDLSTVFSAKKP